MRRCTGQASSDYVAVLAVLAVVFAGAGATAGGADVARAVASQARTALCIVGGDVCRSSDAARAGLEPCVLSATEKSRRLGATIVIVRFGEDRAVLVEHRSDGTAAVSQVTARDLGGSAGRGLQLGPVTLGIDAGGGSKWRGGKSWELPDLAAADRLVVSLRDPRNRIPPPTYTYFAGGHFFDGAARVGPVGGSAAGGHMLGRRVGRGQTTWYRDVSGEAAAVFGPLLPRAPRSARKSLVLEATTDSRGIRSLVLRGVIGRSKDQVVELRSSLDLSVPANAAAARDLLSLDRSPSPISLVRALTALRPGLQEGLVERSLFEIKERSTGFGVGKGISGEYRERIVERRLLAADVIEPDGRQARRFDCAPHGAGTPA